MVHEECCNYGVSAWYSHVENERSYAKTKPVMHLNSHVTSLMSCHSSFVAKPSAEHFCFAVYGAGEAGTIGQMPSE